MEIDIHITRKNVKNINLRIRSDGRVNISAPYRVSDRYIDRFIESKKEWIIAKLNELAEKNKKTIQIRTFNYKEVLFLGKVYRLQLNKADQYSIELFEDRIEVNLLDVNHVENIIYLIEDMYNMKAKKIFVEAINKYSKILQQPVNRVSIKKMKTRWGSCNHVKRYINLNLELIKQPIEFIEYVVLHELAHLVHPNHSKDFWGYVERYMPDYIQRKSLIKY